MKSKYLAPARLQITNPELLINLVSRRVRQLTQGQRPLIVVEPRMDPCDIALKEICDGKLSYELAPDVVPAGEAGKL